MNPNDLLEPAKYMFGPALTFLVTNFFNGKTNKAKFANLEAQTTALKEQTKSLEYGRVSDLLNQLQKQNDRLEGDIVQLRNFYDKRIEGLESEIRRLNSSHLTETAKDQSRIAQLEAQVIELKSQIALLQPQLDNRTVQVLDLQSRNRILEEELAKYRLVQPALMTEVPTGTASSTVVTTVTTTDVQTVNEKE